MASKNPNPRYRNFATIVYPESAPENWIEILADENIPAFISPLHDKDITAEGEVKKAHYHVMVMFEGKKSVEQAEEIFDKIYGVGCKVLNSARSYARYLVHMDDADKYQYNINDVKSLGGASYHTLIGTMADKNRAIREMIAYIDSEDIVSFYELVKYSVEHNSEWYDCLLNSGSYFIKEFIKSRTWKLYKYVEQ